MAYTAPTTAQLKTMFPAFEAVADLTVQMWIDRAATQVDTSWLETDYAYAIELLACHLMVQMGLGTGAEAKVNSLGMSSFSTIRSGQLTLQRGSTSRDSSVPAPWSGDWYGEQFYWLMRKNRPAFAVALAPASFPAGWEWPCP